MLEQAALYCKEGKNAIGTGSSILQSAKKVKCVHEQRGNGIWKWN
jgi:hypothetical protein